MYAEIGQLNDTLFYLFFIYLFTRDVNDTTGTSVHCHNKHTGPNVRYQSRYWITKPNNPTTRCECHIAVYAILNNIWIVQEVHNPIGRNVSM